MEHHVYFWLADDHLNDADRAEFEQGLDSLLTIDQGRDGIWGTPAPVADRPVIDNSWHYALSIRFDDVAAHDVYQDHPVHEAFISKFKPWWAKVRVSDMTGG